MTTKNSSSRRTSSKCDPRLRGVVVSVSLSERKGEKKRPVPAIRLVENHGVEGDAHAGEWHRQVSLLSLDSIKKMREAGLDVNPGDFAENITVEGLDFTIIRVGARIFLGEEAVVIVTQKGKECHDRCEIYRKVGDCVMPREGIFARVLRGGEVRPGDSVEVVVEK